MADAARISRLESQIDELFIAENPPLDEVVSIVLGYLGGVVLTDDIDDTTAAGVCRMVNAALAECLAQRGQAVLELSAPKVLQ